VIGSPGRRPVPGPAYNSGTVPRSGGASSRSFQPGVVGMRRTMLGGLVLAGLILAVGNPVPEIAVAQAKKDTKAAKDAKDRRDAKAGVIEISKGKDDKYRFFVRDGDGKLVAMSGPGGFETTKDAEAAIEHLKEVVAKAKAKVVDK
jgi:uncharacterized protein YegP (UPF0339 family)